VPNDGNDANLEDVGMTKKQIVKKKWNQIKRVNKLMDSLLWLIF